MKLYRYRFANIGAFSEILSGCAWHSRLDLLNDPFEGMYVNRSGREDLDRHVESSRVCCFSEEKSSLLLWAHYADNHRGICLEYEVPEYEFRSRFMEVKYREELPLLNQIDVNFDGHLLVNVNKASGSVFLTKSLDWAYEKEWRVFVVSDKKSEGELVDVPGRLSAVYFGLRSSGSTRAIATKLSPHCVELYDSFLQGDSYQLGFNRLR